MGLSSKDTLVVLTYAKAGLGHLRVTNALLEGYPGKKKPLLMSSIDEATTSLHRFTSLNPIARELAETAQTGIFEDVFTAYYRGYIRRRARLIQPQIEAILSKNEGLRRIIFVSTHFGLAHQLGELKIRLADKYKIDMHVVVVVTDDSPQHA